MGQKKLWGGASNGPNVGISGTKFHKVIDCKIHQLSQPTGLGIDYRSLI